MLIVCGAEIADVLGRRLDASLGAMIVRFVTRLAVSKVNRIQFASMSMHHTEQAARGGPPTLVARQIVARYSGIQIGPNQNPHPRPSPAGIGYTCRPFQLNGWWSRRPSSMRRLCQSTGPTPPRPSR